MDFIMNYWWVIVIGIAAIAVIGYNIYAFANKSSDVQIAQVKEWLLWAVAEAEKELGGGTGQLKLRYVYDLFLLRFNYLANVITFEAFSLLVDEVLETFREMLTQNPSVKNYIESKEDK